MRLHRSRLRRFLLVVALCALPATAVKAAAQENPAQKGVPQRNTAQEIAAPDAAAQDVVPTVEAPQPSPTPIRDEAERLGRELWMHGVPDMVQAEGTTFRLGIRAPEASTRAPWLDDDPPLTRRPVGGSIYHEEMLRQIVPEQFRASTFNTAGVGIDPAVIVNGIRGAWRDWQVQRIRAQIARELEDLEDANAGVSR